MAMRDETDLSRCDDAAAFDPAQVPILFVCGLHRSGTSVLARLLASAATVRPMSATGAAEDEGQHLQPVMATAEAHGGPGLFAFDPGAHLTETSELATPHQARRVLDAWLPHWHLGSSDRLGWGGCEGRLALLEKSPPNLIRTRLLQTLFPGSRFVALVRHPAVVTVSTGRWRPALAPATLLRHWVRAHELFSADASALHHVHLLRYEDLLARPAAETKRLAGAVPIAGPFDRGLLQPGHSTPHLQHWQAISRNLLRSERLQIERVVRRFGYSLDEPYTVAGDANHPSTLWEEPSPVRHRLPAPG